jgi:tetratricopeptide (TPR) repeat protein
MLVCAAACAALATPAAASVFVIGSSSARMCFEAADSPLSPTPDSLRRCDEALADGAISTHDAAATHVNRGILRMRRDQTDLALADFDAAIRVDPAQPEAYLNKAGALIRLQGDNLEAVRLFTAALDNNTVHPELAHFGRAIANEDLGNIRAAYQDYRAASALCPRWALPRTELQRFRVVER